MARLPQPGGDAGNWGVVLNEYLSQSHTSDGLLKDNSVTSATLAPNSVTSVALATGAVTTTALAEDAVSRNKLTAAVRAELDGYLTQAETDTRITTIGDSTYAPIALTSQVVKSVNGVTPNGAGNVTIATGDAVPVTAIPIVRWGDSLTANWSTRLAPLLAAIGRTGLDNQGFGIGSQKSDQIAARQGGAPARVVTDITIPAASTPVALTPNIDILQGTAVAVGSTRSLSVSLMGVKGTLTATNPGTTPWTYTFTRSTPGYAINVAASTPIQTGFEYHDHLPIIWTGRNSTLLPGAVTAIPALIESMLKNTRQRDRALVLSIPPINTEVTGSANRTTLDAVNAAIRDAFASNFVDVAAWVRDPNVITALGYTLTGQDTTDIANGVTPSQLRTDTLHLNDAGYNVLNAAIEHEFKSRGYALVIGGDVTAPSVPGTPSAIAGDSSATLSFTPSSDNVAVVGYEAYSSVDGYSAIAATNSTSPITVTGLSNGTAVSFKVTAYDAAGNRSAKSSASASVTPSAAWSTYTSDSFTGSGSLYGTPNRATDTVNGGTTKNYALASNTDKFTVSGGILRAGASPGYSTAAVATGFADARASIKITEKLTTLSSTTALIVIDCARSAVGSSGTTALGVRVTQTSASQLLGARLNLVDSGGSAAQGPSTTVTPGDTVGVSAKWDTNGTSAVVTMWINGIATDTLTYTGTKPSGFAGFSAGHTTDTTWQFDNFLVEQAI
ncbi:hypothetical protein A2791_05815 [Candidatus Saccharibacteria bacterium RIFCSPHIGHO2_01_FULL_46_30]|nr:MAG: hypothetical protein A2791_05815 [Candidatus Saccharibacteria bacterium RIFCSPHIGHO2_01_FULL_46_30]